MCLGLMEEEWDVAIILEVYNAWDAGWDEKVGTIRPEAVRNLLKFIKTQKKIVVTVDHGEALGVIFKWY